MTSGPGSPRSTLRAIAAEAGVSQMTVSRALSGRGRVAEKTRQRVQAIAQRLRYRPDPEVAKLMHHLRSRHRTRFQSLIAAVTTRPAADREAYNQALLAGVEAQAERRGYSVLLERIPPSPEAWTGLNRKFRSRGVQGVLLLPQHQPLSLRELLDWPEYSVVAATASVLAPAVNRVVPDHLANALLLCRQLAARGHRRVGLALSRTHDERVGHRFTAAFARHAQFEAAEAPRPLLFDDLAGTDAAAWIRRERPDVIVVAELAHVAALRRQLRGGGGRLVPFALLARPSNLATGLAGIDERPYDIGGAAVDLLAAMVEHRVRGLPAAPTATLLPGIWRE